MRDQLFDIKYFEEYIKSEIEGRIDRKDKLLNNEIINDRIFKVKSFIARDILYTLIAKYSAGYSIEDLYPDYYEAVDYMHQSWMVLDNRAFRNEEYFNHYFGTDYDLMLWMLSLAYLMNVNEAVFKKLVEIIDRFTVRDILYEKIIRAKFPDRPKIEAESYKLIMDIPWVYEKLRMAATEPDDQYGKERAQALIEAFLEKDFYKRHKDYSFYDNHKSKQNVYFGYWSIESAAICAIIGVISDEIIQNKYFPKDMYAYKMNKE